jgi:hypothetical protein
MSGYQVLGTGVICETRACHFFELPGGLSTGFGGDTLGIGMVTCEVGNVRPDSLINGRCEDLSERLLFSGLIETPM